MSKSQPSLSFWRLCLTVFAGLSMVLSFMACKASRPTKGLFPIKVIVLTSDQAGIPNVSVQINGKEIGKTDKYGTFVGTHKGKEGEYVRIKVVGAGKGNFFVFKKPLKMRKTQRGWIPLEIKVNAFLRPSAMDGSGDDDDDSKTAVAAAGDNSKSGSNDGQDSDKQETPKTNVDTAGGGDSAGGSKLKDDNPPPARRDDNPPPARRDDNPPPIRRDDNPPPIRRDDNPPPIRRDDNPPPIRTRVAEPPPRPRPSGKYEIAIRSNVKGTRVYCRGCRRRYLGRIRDAGGSLLYKHRDRRSTPRALKFTFKLRGRTRYAYKESKIKKELTLDTSREKYEVDAAFEKKPPIKISVSANLAGIKVYLNRKMQGSITDPSQPYVIEYTNYRRRRVRIEMRPPNRKIKPRRIRKTVRFKKGEYNYEVKGEFKAPEPVKPPTPPAPRGDNPPMPNNNALAANPGGGDAVKPPPREVFKGVYKLTISANAAGIYVYRGRRKLGFIPQAGGSLVYTHKDRRKRPRRLVLRFRAKNRYAYKVRSVTKRVALEWGRAEYQVSVEFEARPALKISLKSNIPGVRVKINGRKTMTLKAANQAEVFTHTGRPMRRARIEFYSPNPRLFRPRRIRQRLRIKKGRYEYEASATFTEYDPGDSVVLKPRCFRRKRGRKRVVVLQATRGTRFYLKGDCNEVLAKAGKSGRIRVRMPVGTWQRVWAGSRSSQKVFEVKRGGGPMLVKFVAGSGKRCQLNRIRKKIINKIPLEEEEVNCLKKVRKGHSQFFSSQLHLARFYCQQKMRGHGSRLLNLLGRNARNKFNPYRSLKLGIEFGRCKNYRNAVRFLKYTEQRINRFSSADRSQNRISLYRAMSTIYEQRYYRRKNAVDLTRALKSAERLADLTSGGQRSSAKREVSRLKKLISQKGGLDD